MYCMCTARLGSRLGSRRNDWLPPFWAKLWPTGLLEKPVGPWPRAEKALTKFIVISCKKSYCGSLLQVIIALTPLGAAGA